MPDTGAIHFTIVDGTRQMLAPEIDVLFGILNGAADNNNLKWAKGGDIRYSGIAFDDTDHNAYNVYVSPKGFNKAVTPYRVPLVRNGTADVALLATPKNGQFHFQKWDQFRNVDPRILKLITNGATGDPAQRYSDTAEKQNLQLGALLNLATAIRDIPLDDRPSPLDDFYWEVMWDELAPDRFWAWVDAKLVDHIRTLAKLHAFAPEDKPQVWHPGIPGKVDAATVSWKQIRFDVTNVQLTFHENTRTTRIDEHGNTVSCVVIEPDIDLYKDLLAHGLTEVVPNLFSGGKTDPRTVYAMRWMATRQEKGVPEFSPPVTIEA
jgi:hypothetical protein